MPDLGVFAGVGGLGGVALAGLGWYIKKLFSNGESGRETITEKVQLDPQDPALTGLTGAIDRLSDSINGPLTTTIDNNSKRVEGAVNGLNEATRAFRLESGIVHGEISTKLDGISRQVERRD